MNFIELKYNLRKAEEIARDMVIVENEIARTPIEEEKEMLRKSHASLVEQLNKINDSLLPLFKSGKQNSEKTSFKAVD